MTTPGLYAHFKGRDLASGGKKYRVLFTAVYVSMGQRFELEPIGIAVGATGNLIASYETDGSLFVAKSASNVPARWSDTLVVYVALYGDGQIWARTEREFSENVPLFAGHTGTPRFERVGD